MTERIVRMIRNIPLRAVLACGACIGLLILVVLFTPKTTVITLLLLLSVTILVVRRWISQDRVLLLIILAGVTIRWRYASVTGIGVRSHDWWGHLEYLRFLSKTWSIPPAGGGWEFQQPPLYYAIGALILRAGAMLGLEQDVSEIWVQQCSLPLSVGTLLLGTWIGTMLLKKEEQWMQWIFVGIIATLPGFVTVSSQLTNDALITPLLFACFGMLLLWWKKPTWTIWIMIWIVASLAFLTKANAIAILPATLLSALLHPTLSVGKKIILSSAGIFLFSCSVLWMIESRLHASPADLKHFLSIGIPGFPETVRAQYTIFDFITFNPIEVWKHPIITSFEEELLRKKFLEYFFRSALFSELREERVQLFLPIVSYALLLLPWMIWGFVSEIKRKDSDSIPFFLSSMSVLLAAVSFIVTTRFVSNQHFRYSVFLGLTCAFLLVRGIQKSHPLLRMAGIIIATFLCVLMGALILTQ